MTFLEALASQCLNVLLVASAALLIPGLLDWIETRLCGGSGAGLIHGWSDLLRLVRKETVSAVNASLAAKAAPCMCFASVALSSILVPTFALGMAFAPVSDLLVIAGLLAFGHVILSLAAMDSGTSNGGLAAMRMARTAGMAEPALFLLTIALGLLGGSTNLDVITGLQREGALQPATASALAAVALVLIALAQQDGCFARAAREFSGPDLALLRATDALRLVLWLDLLFAVFLPVGLAAPDAGVVGWLRGTAYWLLKLAICIPALALARVMLGRVWPSETRTYAGIAILAALLAVLLALASSGAT
ncbi:MAG: NADH-quinone oxidoreductase subunit H [Acetobacteraceae bacterium]|nr:NADH-quinone oxidoreductase subunit H [Acetobacteraceae bacterium]